MRSDILDQVQSLSVSERIELVEAIWDTIPSDASVEAVPLDTFDELPVSVIGCLHAARDPQVIRRRS